MKASRQNAAGILVYMLLSVGALSWGLLSLHGIDLVSEPFGSMMVMSRAILSLAVLGAVHQIMKAHTHVAPQTIRTRVRSRR